MIGGIYLIQDDAQLVEMKEQAYDLAKKAFFRLISDHIKLEQALCR